ncbi:hypothetical protein EVU96_24905 [Bacillus infantis]|uniref:hypothetical protein n=1 Tax=Bacillus infantis TaxID=324767 RepID=UPI00101D8A99|nr:hypothetical protein [Bacillus infantis]RYI25208.1 hypothetical protein EVU96_24905 [Bacillus infantis]
MSNALNFLLDRVPSHLRTDKDSNNYKLLSILSGQSDSIHSLYETIKRFWNVDQAEGIGLDRLGKEEGLSRGSYDDETYRKLIKIQYIVNLSEGDIETMNTILKAYMGDEFLYIEEGWTSDYQEPATLVINTVDKVKMIDFKLIKRIKPAGVGFYVNVNVLLERISLKLRSWSYPVPYPITNTFSTAQIDGKIARMPISIKEKVRAFEVAFPITNLFQTVEKYEKHILNEVQLITDAYNLKVPYKYSGTVSAGEVEL